MKIKMLYGAFYIILAEFFFTLATVYAKYLSKLNFPALEISFFRFFLGLIFILIYSFIKKRNYQPVNIKYLIFRGVFNTFAVILFFLSVYYTSISKANLLNMTYPFFVLVISFFINKEKIKIYKIFFLILSFLGIYFVVKPDNNIINIGDIFGILSSLTAAFGISSLREANKYDNPETILLFLFLTGVIINGLFLIKNIKIPNGIEVFYLLIASLSGLVGQILLTFGYKHVEASVGSIISTVRIVYSSIFGIVLFSEIFDLYHYIGLFLIINSIIFLSLFQIYNYKKELKIT